VRTRPSLHEDEDKAEAGCYKTEAENFGLEATLASKTRTRPRPDTTRLRPRLRPKFWPRGHVGLEYYDESEAGCYEAEAKVEAENFGHVGLEDLTSVRHHIPSMVCRVDRLSLRPAGDAVHLLTAFHHE